VSLGRSGPGVRSGFLETPRTRFGGVFLAALADRVPVGRSRGFDASGPTPVRGCGCRSRAARLSVPERLPGRRGPARALPSRSAGHGRERRAVVRAVRRGVSGMTSRVRSHPGLRQTASGAETGPEPHPIERSSPVKRMRKCCWPSYPSEKRHCRGKARVLGTACWGPGDGSTRLTSRSSAGQCWRPFQCPGYPSRMWGLAWYHAHFNTPYDLSCG